MSKIAIILGLGFTEGLPLDKQKEHYLDTPYGKPSGPLLTGEIDGVEIGMLFRHGKDGTIPAYKVNYKANIIALYELGFTQVLSTSICGSLQEEILPGEFVVFDQFIDLTKHRELSFIDKIDANKLNHGALHKPFSDDLRDTIVESAIVKGITIHTKATVLAVDGPRQSTRAESNLYRKFGSDLVNTSTTPEAILTHELGMGYGALSLCTYFDSWRTDIQPSNAVEKKNILNEHIGTMRELILESIKRYVS